MFFKSKVIITNFVKKNFAEAVEIWLKYEFENSDGTMESENLFEGADKVRLQNFIIDEAFVRMNKALLSPPQDAKKPNSTFLGKAKFLSRVVGKNLPIVTERSFVSNEATFIAQLRDRGLISNLDFALLSQKSKQLFEMVVETHRLKPLFIHLRDSPENCLKRVERRARKGEETVSLEYLTDLIERLDAFYERIGTSYPTAVIHLSDYEMDDNSGFINKRKLMNRIYVEMTVHFYRVYFPRFFEKSSTALF